MKLAGIITILLGWLIAISSLTMGSNGIRLIVATLGFAVSAYGIIGVLNRAHLANALWKQ